MRWSIDTFVAQCRGCSDAETKDVREAIEKAALTDASLPYFVIPWARSLRSLARRPRNWEALDTAVRWIEERPERIVMPATSTIVGGLWVVGNTRGVAIPLRIERYTGLPSSSVLELGPGPLARGFHRQVLWIWPAETLDAPQRVGMLDRVATLIEAAGTLADAAGSFRNDVWVAYPDVLRTPALDDIGSLPVATANPDDEKTHSLDLALMLGAYRLMRPADSPSPAVEPEFWATGVLAGRPEGQDGALGPDIGPVDYLRTKLAPLCGRNQTPIPVVVSRTTWQDEAIRMDGLPLGGLSILPVSHLAEAVDRLGWELPDDTPYWPAYRRWAERGRAASMGSIWLAGGRSIRDVQIPRKSQDVKLDTFMRPDHAQPVLFVEGPSGTGKTWWAAAHADRLAAQPNTAVVYCDATAASGQTISLGRLIPGAFVDIEAAADHLERILTASADATLVLVVDALDHQASPVAAVELITTLIGSSTLLQHRPRIRVIITLQGECLDALNAGLARQPELRALVHDLVASPGGTRRRGTRLGRGLPALGLRPFDETSARESDTDEGDAGPAASRGEQESIEAYMRYRTLAPRMAPWQDLPEALRSMLRVPVMLRAYFQLCSADDVAGWTADGRSDAHEAALLERAMEARLLRAFRSEPDRKRWVALGSSLLCSLAEAVARPGRDGESRALNDRIDELVVSSSLSSAEQQEVLDHLDVLTMGVTASGLVSLEHGRDQRGLRTQHIRFEHDVWVSYLLYRVWAGRVSSTGPEEATLRATTEELGQSRGGRRAVRLMASDVAARWSALWARWCVSLHEEQSPLAAEVLSAWQRGVTCAGELVAELVAMQQQEDDRVKLRILRAMLELYRDRRELDRPRLDFYREVALPVLNTWVGVAVENGEDEVDLLDALADAHKAVAAELKRDQQPQHALQHHAEVVRIRTELVERSGSTSGGEASDELRRRRMELADALHQQVPTVRQLYDLEASRRIAREALACRLSALGLDDQPDFERVSALIRTPKGAEYVRDLASSHNSLGQVELHAGNLENSIANHLEGVRIRQALAGWRVIEGLEALRAAAVENSDSIRRLWLGLASLSFVLNHAGLREESYHVASVSYVCRQALVSIGIGSTDSELQRALVEEPQYSASMAFGLGILGHSLFRLGAPARALEAYETGMRIELLRSGLTRDCGDEDVRAAVHSRLTASLWLASALSNVGRAYRALRSYGEAEQCHLLEVRLKREIVLHATSTDHAANGVRGNQTRRRELARALAALGVSLLGQGRLADSLRCFEEASREIDLVYSATRTMRSGMGEATGDEGTAHKLLLYGVADVRFGYGRCLAVASRFAEAEQSLVAARDLIVKHTPGGHFLTTDPAAFLRSGNCEALAKYSRATLMLAWVLTQRGMLERARLAYANVLDCYRSLNSSPYPLQERFGAELRLFRLEHNVCPAAAQYPTSLADRCILASLEERFGSV